MNKKKSKGQWGGYRKGSGRPKSDNKKIPRSIAFNNSEWIEVRNKAKSRNLSIARYLLELVLKDI